MARNRQACDCCCIRRVKCDRKKPCKCCLQHNLQCTYLRPLKKRGPKPVKVRNLKKVDDVQVFSKSSSGGIMKVPKALIDQCLRLYNDKLYVIWPLLCYDDLYELLEKRYDETCVYWFLVSLSAATLSDLQTEIESEGGVTFTGIQLSSFCMSSRQEFDDFNGSDIFKIMTYYCLNRCYAQMSNSRTSYRLSCEAVGLIKLAGFHREETLKLLPFDEQQLGRKVYYLLLLTERYFSVYTHCATSLDTTIAPPQPENVTDPRLSLDSFLEMIRVFTVPGKCFFDALATDSANVTCTEDSLKKILRELHTVPLEIEPWSYGYVDISFSRHWIRTLAWKLVLQISGMRISFLSNSKNTHIPVEIARDMLEDTFLIPKNLYAVHGPGISVKALEIADALVDVVNQYDQNAESEAWNFLFDISKFVFSLKHCDSTLVDKFTTKCQCALITLPLSNPLESTDGSKEDVDALP
ncbi:K7_Yfl052wp [Saccharomyces cerevisiae Kyokai no. 7]|uniref:K7_Yfl052wp n=1 Tax=Saccharomyces cerevisiae (strain Kyokai no. 7 / NBRC 101557) TaxID=721032 RepID=G2WD89_YEASK|nr:K7_Yfl052wp [Saccharomyces cerevisiae Kyokai no. 7]